MPNLAQGFVIHFDDGAYVCKPRKITNFDEVVQAHFSAQRRLLINAFALDGVNVDVAVGTGAVCCVRLRKLRLHTYFDQVGDYLVPIFATRGLKLELVWDVPADMDLRFACQCAQVGTHWSMGECFLFARKTGTPGFVKLPLPNTFDDGRLCMGDAVRGTIHGHTVQECFQKALQSFHDTVWNTDIHNNPTRCVALFRWTKERQCVVAPQNWRDLCLGVSRIEMEELCPS